LFKIDQKTNKMTTIESLPIETLLHIVNFVTIEDLVWLQRVNRFWYNLIDTPVVWNMRQKELLIDDEKPSKEDVLTKYRCLNILKRILETTENTPWEILSSAIPVLYMHEILRRVIRENMNKGVNPTNFAEKYLPAVIAAGDHLLWGKASPWQTAILRIMQLVGVVVRGFELVQCQGGILYKYYENANQAEAEHRLAIAIYDTLVYRYNMKVDCNPRHRSYLEFSDPASARKGDDDDGSIKPIQTPRVTFMTAEASFGQSLDLVKVATMLPFQTRYMNRTKIKFVTLSISDHFIRIYPTGKVALKLRLTSEDRAEEVKSRVWNELVEAMTKQLCIRKRKRE
jgi:hypothetical protein